MGFLQCYTGMQCFRCHNRGNIIMFDDYIDVPAFVAQQDRRQEEAAYVEPEQDEDD